VTLVSGEAANERQISAVPNWLLVRCTKTQVKPAPATLLTIVFGEETLSVETKARSSSFAKLVENADVLALVLGLAMFLEVVTSMAIAALAGDLKPKMIVIRILNRRRLRILFISTRPLCVRYTSVPRMWSEQLRD
jgi:hypothetical protein